MKFLLEDLGPACRGDVCLLYRPARDPRTGDEVLLVSLSRSGFVVINPSKRNGCHVTVPKPYTEWWAIGQAPDGAVYQVEYNAGKRETCLVCWRWEETASRTVAHVPGKTFFTLDVAPDGRIYMPEYSRNVMLCYDPQRDSMREFGDYSEFGDHVRDVACGRDGLVYVTCTDYRSTRVAAMDPTTGRKWVVAAAAGAGRPLNWGGLTSDRAGHVLVPSNIWGRPWWYEIRDGALRDIDPRQVMLAQGRGGAMPTAFSDGSYVSAVDETSRPGAAHVRCVGADGIPFEFDVPIEGVPLRIFSVGAGGGRIWMGTFIPLTLAGYEPASGSFTHYGNPTETGGEIYQTAWSCDKLFMASYTQAMLTRYAPGRAWKRDRTAAANPANLGVMKEEGGELQRPYGKAIDARGNVYFAARGDYGVEDSGICRIDPHTEEVTRWIYPQTTFAALCYLPTEDKLLVSEHRKGEDGIRFTFVCPATGAVLESEIVIRDEGDVTAWLCDGGDVVYGLHPVRANLFAYDLKQRRITAELREMRFGHHCYGSLITGPDGRIWGLTNECVYAAERDLSRAEVVVRYEDRADGNFYRFGMCTGPDGHVYFPNGPHLMRIKSA